jgi:hypothetical protein
MKQIMGEKKLAEVEARSFGGRVLLLLFADDLGILMKYRTIPKRLILAACL